MLLTPNIAIGRIGEWIHRVLSVLTLLPAFPFPPLRTLLTILPILSFLWGGVVSLLNDDEDTDRVPAPTPPAEIEAKCQRSAASCDEIAHRVRIAPRGSSTYQ